MAARKKAPAKSKAKAQAKPKNVPQAQLPEGYQPLMGFAQTWQPEPGDELEGEVQQIKTVEVRRGRKTIETQVMEVLSDEDGMNYAVWESAVLRPLFEEAKEGDRVYLVFQGLGTPLKAGQNAPKQYMVGLQKSDEAAF